MHFCWLESERGNMLLKEGNHRVERFSLQNSQKGNRELCMEPHSTNKLKGMQPCWHLDSSLVRHTLQEDPSCAMLYLDFSSMEVLDNEWILFWATMFLIICYSSNTQYNWVQGSRGCVVLTRPHALFTTRYGTCNYPEHAFMHQCAYRYVSLIVRTNGYVLCLSVDK